LLRGCLSPFYFCGSGPRVVFAAWFRRAVLLRGRLRPPAQCLGRSSTSPTRLLRPRRSPLTARGRAAPLRADRRKRFRSMSRHNAEPGCGVLAAVESGELKERRVASYRELLSRPGLGHRQPGRRQPRAARRDGAPPARPGYEERVCGQRPSNQHQADWCRVEMRRSYGMDALVGGGPRGGAGYRAAFDARILFRPCLYFGLRSFSRCATDRSFGASRTSDRDAPPTHLADVLDGFVGRLCEQSGLKQLKRSTKKLVLSKTKLDEDIPGGSTTESVPPSDELEHVALIAGPTSRCGLVAVTGTPPTRAAIVLLLHVISNFQGKARHPLSGCATRQWMCRAGRGSPRRVCQVQRSARRSCSPGGDGVPSGRDNVASREQIAVRTFRAQSAT